MNNLFAQTKFSKFIKLLAFQNGSVKFTPGDWWLRKASLQAYPYQVKSSLWTFNWWREQILLLLHTLLTLLLCYPDFQSRDDNRLLAPHLDHQEVVADQLPTKTEGKMYNLNDFFFMDSGLVIKMALWLYAGVRLLNCKQNDTATYIAVMFLTSSERSTTDVN